MLCRCQTATVLIAEQLFLTLHVSLLRLYVMFSVRFISGYPLHCHSWRLCLKQTSVTHSPHSFVGLFLLTLCLLFYRSGPSRLMGHSAVAYRDSILLFGGGESQNSPKNNLWRYSFTTQTWMQVATLTGSNSPEKIHHCCTGLGASYKSNSSHLCSSSELKPRLLDGRIRPFKNKCFPAKLTFLGSEGAIELETFSPDQCYSSKTLPQYPELVVKAPQQVGNCLTFENKAFRKQCTDEELMDEEDEDVAQHLPDLLLVLGGRPCSRHSPISMWQMTLTDS